MQLTELFALGLGLTPPWKIVDIEFIDGEVHIKVDFERGARFGGLEVHDTSERKWRHLNFFKYPCFIHARVPRVIGKDGKVATVQVPWAHAGSGFTMDFEAAGGQPIAQTSSPRVPPQTRFGVLRREPTCPIARGSAGFSRSQLSRADP